jgi:hypothetical protein
MNGRLSESGNQAPPGLRCTREIGKIVPVRDRPLLPVAVINLPCPRGAMNAGK